MAEDPRPDELQQFRSELTRLAVDVAALSERLAKMERQAAYGRNAANSVDSPPSSMDIRADVLVDAATEEYAAKEPPEQQEQAPAHGPIPPPLPRPPHWPPRPPARGLDVAESFGPKERAALESAIGSRGLTWLGGFILILAVGFAVHWWWTTFTVPVWVRVSATHALGVAILAAAHVCQHRLKLPLLAKGLAGVGIFALYAAGFTALRLFHAWGESIAFVEGATITALAVLIAVRADSVGVILLGALGGYLTPFLTASDPGGHVILFAYLALLNVALLGAAVWKRWDIVKPITMVAIGVVFFAWLAGGYKPMHRDSTEWLLVLHAIILQASVLAPALGLRRSTNASDWSTISGSALGFFGFLWMLHFEETGKELAAVSWSLGALQLLLFWVAYRRLGNDDRLPRVLLGLAAVFLTLAVPLQLDDFSYLGIAWCVEGLLFTALGVYFSDPQLRISGAIVLLLGALRLWIFDYLDSGGYADFHVEPKLSWMLSASALLYVVAGAMEWLLPRRSRPESADTSLGTPLSATLLAAGNVMALLSLTTQWLNRGTLAVWTLDAAVLLFIGFVFDLPKLRGYALAVAVLMANGLALRLGVDPSVSVPIFNARFASLAFLAIVYLLAGLAYWKRNAETAHEQSPRSQTILSPEEDLHLDKVVGVLGHAILLFAISMEISDIFDLSRWQAFWSSNIPMAALASFSIVWAIYATLVVGAGFLLRYPFYRWLGLAGFLGVLLKVFAIDMANLDLLPRVLAFAGLGLALLGTSLLYQRFASRV